MKPLLAAALLLTLTLPLAADEELMRVVARGVKVATVSDARHEMACYDGSDLQVWDFVGVVPQHHWVSAGTPTWMRFSPDESTLVVGVAEKRLVAYTPAGERRWVFGTDEVPRPVRFSADSQVVGVALPDGHGVDLLDTPTGKLLNAVTGKAYLNDYAFSPQGDRLALSWDDGRLQICHADGRPAGVWTCAGVPGRLAWAPDGRRLLVGVGDRVQLLSMGKAEAMYATDRWHLSPDSWSPGGTHFALDHFRAPNRYGVSLRELPDGRVMRYDETNDHVTVDWSPDNHLMAVATDKVRVYRLVDGEEAFVAPDVQTRQAWFAPHGHRMAVWTWDGSIRIWDF